MIPVHTRKQIVTRKQLWHQLQPYDGVIKLQGNVGETLAVLEPSVFVTPAGVELWHTFSYETTPGYITIRRAVAPTIDDTFVLDDSYIGNGKGGVAAGKSSNCGYGWYDAGTYYMIAGSSYNNPTFGDGKCRLYTATSLAGGFTETAVLLDSTSYSGYLACGNVALILDETGKPVQIGGKYQMLAEIIRTGFTWQIFHGEANNIAGPWTLTGFCSGLEVANGGTFGGAWAVYLDGVTHILYHYCPIAATTLPTYIGYATSTDGGVTATIRETPATLTNPQPFAATDQAADPWLVEINGRCYFFYELVDNSYVSSTTIQSHIRMKSYNCTMHELFKNIYRFTP